MTRRLLISNTTSQTTSSGALFEALAQKVNQSGRAVADVHHLGIEQSRTSKIRAAAGLTRNRLSGIWRADVILVHTSVVFFTFEILLGRLLGKRVKAIFWDSYPESFHAFSDQQSLSFGLKIYRIFERRLLKLCHTVYLPNSDYDERANAVGIGRTRYLPLWPFTERLEPIEPAPDPREDILNIGFAGAINKIRGIPEALDLIAAKSTSKVIVHVFGSDAPIPLNAETAARVELRRHGQIRQSVLIHKLRQLDAGLVSLHPEFRLPAFPSKIVSNIASGLPILYVGPNQPALQQFLDETSVGITVERGKPMDLAAEVKRLKNGFEQAQANALAALELNEARLADILQ